MAAYTIGETAITATLTANVADTVSLKLYGQHLEIINLDLTSIIWIRWDGTAATVAGTDCVPVPANSSWIPPAHITIQNSLSLISNGTPQYCVSRIVNQ